LNLITTNIASSTAIAAVVITPAIAVAVSNFKICAKIVIFIVVIVVLQLLL
jgi:hypothetical protein